MLRFIFPFVCRCVSPSADDSMFSRFSKRFETRASQFSSPDASCISKAYEQTDDDDDDDDEVIDKGRDAESFAAAASVIMEGVRDERLCHFYIF